MTRLELAILQNVGKHFETINPKQFNRNIRIIHAAGQKTDEVATKNLIAQGLLTGKYGWTNTITAAGRAALDLTE